MKTTTTTREYDAEGRLVKEIICEIVTHAAPVLPQTCTCSPSSFTWCPVHGSRVTYPGAWYSQGGCVAEVRGQEGTFTTNGSLS